MRLQLLGVFLAVAVVGLGGASRASQVCDQYAEIASETQTYLNSHGDLSPDQIDYWTRLIQWAVDHWWNGGCYVN